MTSFLLDTQVLVWLCERDIALGKKARAYLSEAHACETLYVSAISFWEIGMLVAKKRITLSRPVDFWRSDVLQTGVHEIALSGEIGLLSTQINMEHGDPADRMVVATAIMHNHTLVTSDKKILQWKNPLKRVNARV